MPGDNEDWIRDRLPKLVKTLKTGNFNTLPSFKPLVPTKRNANPSRQSKHCRWPVRRWVQKPWTGRNPAPGHQCRSWLLREKTSANRRSRVQPVAPKKSAAKVKFVQAFDEAEEPWENPYYHFFVMRNIAQSKALFALLDEGSVIGLRANFHIIGRRRVFLAISSVVNADVPLFSVELFVRTDERAGMIKFRTSSAHPMDITWNTLDVILTRENDGLKVQSGRFHGLAGTVSESTEDVVNWLNTSDEYRRRNTSGLNAFFDDLIAKEINDFHRDRASSQQSLRPSWTPQWTLPRWLFYIRALSLVCAETTHPGRLPTPARFAVPATCTPFAVVSATGVIRRSTGASPVSALQCINFNTSMSWLSY
ncbi:uncharacterized protein LOC129580789 [Paramacrobiotus metropolitanus]|uniref:uncharacterized protein LOC129580789 n=1 Tax=Paramacrobiotus metropolitanus TaxID=2943436 RepID=UPI0024462BBF|nr:uncharacterized protein LOC129580789 [Paramacrobiotus metropolitanus]